MKTTERLCKDFITRRFNFRKVDILDWSSSKTVWKELAGYFIIKEFLPDLQWIENSDLQKQGVDFIYKNKYHDLKSLVGDYHTDRGLNIILEVSQYGKPSLTADKLTDVLVYTILEETSVSLVFINYKMLVHNLYRLDKYERKTSFNGSGCYIKIPVGDLIDILGKTGVVTLKYQN